MLKLVLASIALLVAAVLVYAATRPDSFRVQRTITINAPAERIFPHINDFHAWEAWSPWEGIDPQLKRSYSGATSGKGAVYAWQGNRDIGQGRMEILESNAPQTLKIDIQFIVPFEARNTIEFTLQPQGEQTVVTQAMYGPSPYIAKLMGLFFSMDKMVGEKYEQGLASLKTLAEKH